MDIDPNTLKVTLRDGIPGLRPPPGELFLPRYMQTWASIEHVNDDQRYCVFSLNGSGILTGRSKIQELARGDFGTVYAWTNSGYETGARISLDVRPYGNRVGHEKPDIGADPHSGNSVVDGISVVRIFPTGPGFIIASGLYSRDGVLQNVVYDAATNGDWIHQNRIPEVDKTLETNVIRPDDYIRLSGMFGFPGRLKIGDLLLDIDQWRSGSRTAATTFVNLHYDRNQWVRQTSFKSSGEHEVRFLNYRVTAQDRALERIDKQAIVRPAVVRP